MEETELEWLRFFYQHADFGPSDDDVRRSLENWFIKSTGKSLPSGYERAE